MAQYIANVNRVGACNFIRQTHNIALSLQPKRLYSSFHQTRNRSPPEAKNGMTTESFLMSIGRDAVSKVKVTKWEDFWNLDGYALRGAGVGVRDRRCILWCMEKYRQGHELSEFAHPPTPKKKIRGHGPAVQNGKRIRSRRHR